MQVLLGTLALVAGCSTAQRAEVSGVVRDRATGRVIAGARVVGADGSLAETDSEGRFRLYVYGALADVRVSAAGHSSEHVAIEGLDARVELAPLDAIWGEDESAHVVTFVEETWVLDAGVAGDASSMHACPRASDGACASCHGEEARTVEGAFAWSASVASAGSIAPHAQLGDGSTASTCLACHAGADAGASCARCHGADAAALAARTSRFFELATSRTPDRIAEGTAFEMRSTLTRPSTDAAATWASVLARDRSHGAHDPRTLRHLAEWTSASSSERTERAIRASFDYSPPSESPASPSSSPASASSSPP